MVSPHLLRDLRLLHRVLCPNAPKASQSSTLGDLFEPVFAQSTRRAFEALELLCAELAGADDPARSPLASLEPFETASANLGVRARSPLQPGQLVCFYPGRIFTSEAQLPPGDQLFTNEYDNIHLARVTASESKAEDGKAWYPAAWRQHEALTQRPPPHLWHGNRLAVGNLLNHPQPTQLPNVAPMAFAWPGWQQLGIESPAFWARLVPHVEVGDNGRVARTPSGEAGQKATFPAWPHLGLAFFALREVEAEELLLNYRLSPPFPSWYSPVDEDALDAEVERHL
ncbi:unnamed protein product [Effrenium voratum]|uniref:SET domain-containing protein n=1 Tax=Effrenium voratum TaxID=2562239 RepID=A0AA36JFV0_9DINO|nr:unnamed protein product [Effrenium voratum]